MLETILSAAICVLIGIVLLLRRKRVGKFELTSKEVPPKDGPKD